MIERESRDDFERIRQGRAALVWPQPDLSGGGVPAFVGRVTSVSSRIAVGDFLMVQPTFVMGDESEGASGNFASFGSSTVPVYLLGPGLAATGDYLVCKFVDNRWVAERTTSSGGSGSGSSGTIPSCFCANMPVTLAMTSYDESCNFGMFQSCTLQYGATPSVYANLGLGPNAYISLQSFPDPIADGALFQYFLTCQSNQFGLTRIYPTSPYASPFRDGVLYAWFVGAYGNTCSPFHLDNGIAFPGSDASCFVTIDG